jgi:hypothetical protein
LLNATGTLTIGMASGELYFDRNDKHLAKRQLGGLSSIICRNIKTGALLV